MDPANIVTTDAQMLGDPPPFRTLTLKCPRALTSDCTQHTSCLLLSYLSGNTPHQITSRAWQHHQRSSSEMQRAVKMVACVRMAARDRQYVAAGASDWTRPLRWHTSTHTHTWQRHIASHDITQQQRARQKIRDFKQTIVKVSH